jgi:hypothetical protein
MVPGHTLRASATSLHLPPSLSHVSEDGRSLSRTSSGVLDWVFESAITQRVQAVHAMVGRELAQRLDAFSIVVGARSRAYPPAKRLVLVLSAIWILLCLDSLIFGAMWPDSIPCSELRSRKACFNNKLYQPEGSPRSHCRWVRNKSGIFWFSHVFFCLCWHGN